MIKAFFEIYKVLSKLGIKPKDVIGMGGNIVKMGKSLFNTRINPKLITFIEKNQKIPTKILEDIKLHGRTLKNATENQKNLFLENIKSIQKAKTPPIPKSSSPVTGVKQPGTSVKEQAAEAFKGWKPTVIKGGKDPLATGGIANHFRKKFNEGELVDEVNGLMEKTPFFTQEDYNKVKYKDPKGKYAVENWGKGEAPLAEATEDNGIVSYMGKFVEGETEKNLDKAKVLAHEKLHLLWEDPEVRATAPPKVQEQFSKADKLWKKYEKSFDAGDDKKADAYYDEFDKTSSGVPLDPDNPTTGGGDVTGEELYTRFIENKYFPQKTESDEGPWGDRVHFDKTLKAQWDPYAERFDTLMRSRQAHGGIANHFRIKKSAGGIGDRVGFDEGTRPVLPRDKFVELRIKYKNTHTNTEFAELLNKDWKPAQADFFHKDNVTKRIKDSKNLFPDNFDYKGSHVERALTPKKYISVMGEKEYAKFKDTPKKLKWRYEYLRDKKRPDFLSKRAEKNRLSNRDLSEKTALDRKEKAIVRRQSVKGYDFYKVNKAENLLWNDLLRTAKNKNGYFKFKGDAPVKGEYYNKAATENFVLVDKNNNEFKYSTLSDDVTKHSGYKLDDVLRPYKQKEFLATEGLTKELNKLAGYEPGSPKSVFHTQHIEGIDKNPWKVHLTFGTQNIKESASRKSFNADWKAATYVDENGKTKVRYNDVGKIGDANYKPGGKTAINRYYKSLGPDIVAQISKKPRGEIKTLIELLDKTGIKLTETQRIAGLNLEKIVKDVAKVKSHAASKGIKLNSFAGLVDLSQSGIELPPSVAKSLDDVIKIGGKILRGVGKGAIVLDPIFAALDAAEAFGKGASGAEAAEYVVKRFGEGVLNIPGLVIGGTQWAKGKVLGENTKFETPYEFTFARDKLKKQLDETPENVKLRRIAEIEFDQTMPYMVDVMDMPESREELEIKKDKFLKEELGENYKITHPKQVEEEKPPTDNLTGVDKYMINRFNPNV